MKHLFLLIALAGCPLVHRDPTIEAPPSGCVNGATVCRNGAPWRCNDNEWSQADRVCGLLNDAGSIGCCLTASPFPNRAPIHACVPATACLAETP
jgi:hypothetical protein